MEQTSNSLNERTLEPGEIFESNFRIDALIGRGAGSVVYRAYHLVMQREIALKILKSESLANEKTVARFKQEALSLSQLDSKYILKIFSFGISSAGLPYLVCELLEGKDLSSQLEILRTLKTSQLCTIFKQMAAGLNAAHKAGILHRDLKPANIMLSQNPDGSFDVKLVDFGLAKFFEDDTVQSLTSSGVLVGSPSYMSPEQCQSKPLEPSSDLYSLGVVMYQIIAGRHPFDAATDMEMMYKHVSEEVTPLNKLPGAVDAELGKIIMRCLEKDPSKRYQSAAELIDALSIIEGSKPSAIPSEKLPLKNSLPKNVALGTVVALVVFGAIFACYIIKPKAAPEADMHSMSKAPHLVTLVDDYVARVTKDPDRFVAELRTALERDRASSLTRAKGYALLADHMFARRDVEQARIYYKKALSLKGKQADLPEADAWARREGGYAEFLTKINDAAEAERVAKSAAEDIKKRQGSYWDLAWLNRILDAVYALQGRYSEGLELRKDVLKADELRDTNNGMFVSDLLCAAEDSFRSGKRGEAIKYCHLAEGKANQTQKLKDIDRAHIYIAIAEFYCRTDYGNGAKMLEYAEAIAFSPKSTIKHSDGLSAKVRIQCCEAWQFLKDGNIKLANEQARLALADIDKLEKDHKIKTLDMLGDFYVEAGKPEIALKVYAMNAKYIDYVCIKNVVRPLQNYAKMAVIYEKSGNNAKARECYQQALENCPSGYIGADLEKIKAAYKRLSS